MNPKVKICTFLLVWIYFHSYGQIDQYRYARELKGITEQWHQVKLPEELFGRVRGDLSDMRIYGITENQDTVEAPYLLRIKREKLIEKEIPSRVINAVQNEKGYYFTFEVNSQNSINQINLVLGQENFDWKIILEGSQDQKEWFNVLKDYRILSIKNGQTDFQFTDLSFPAASYRYYRLFIPNDKKPDLLTASTVHRELIPGIVDIYPIAQTRPVKSAQKKVTEVEITLKRPVPVSSLKIDVTDTFDYYRPITISYLYDSVETQQGWKYDYRPLASGTLNSLKQNDFKFESTILHRLKITIQNQDNQHLNLGDFEVGGFLHELVARFSQPATYLLVYGNDHAPTPNYDIQQFADKIPENAQFLEIGSERQISDSADTKTHPLFENKAWLWAVMVIIIAVLGWSTLSMMKKK